MKLVTAEQMRRLDAAAMAGGIPSLALMERAGKGLAACVRRMMSAPAVIGVVLGAGNNSGDGVVAARYLTSWGFRLRLFCTRSITECSPDTQTNWVRLVPGTFTLHDALHATVDDFAQCACLIDAMLGTGLAQPVREPLRTVIERMNQSGVRIIAADMPSGLCADTGAPLGLAVRAHTTVTFGLPKLGLVVTPGPDYAGRIEMVDIGLPTALVDAMTTPYLLNTPDGFMANWSRRSAEAHKGTCGHALVIAGSRGMIGAGFLASKAALRVGAGLVTYALAAAAYEKFDPHAAEVMVAPIPDEGTGALTAASQAALRAQLAGKRAVAMGPGLGRATPTAQLVRALISQCTVPTVLDADALYAVADDLPILQKRKTDLVLTPHPGEMAHLCGQDTAAITADRLGVAQSFSTTHGVYVVLKGHRTVMAAPDGAVVINTTGNAGMATAGAGDVLTGILTGLLAQGMPLPAAMHAGVYLHGLAGDLAAAHQGEQAMIASDIIEALPEAIRMLGGGKA